METLQGAWKQHLRLRAVVGYGVKIFPPSPPNYVTRSPGFSCFEISFKKTDDKEQRLNLLDIIFRCACSRNVTRRSFKFSSSMKCLFLCIR